MKIHHAYKGILNGIRGVWSDRLPEGVVVDKEFLFIKPDSSEYELQNKETKEKRFSVIIENESEVENWEEVKTERRFPIKEVADDRQ